MLKITGKITLLKDSQKSVIISGYRPAFMFGDVFLTGSINLLEKDILHPNEQCFAEIFVIHVALIPITIEKGTVIPFFEPPHKIGVAEILGYEIFDPDLALDA